MNFPTDLPAFEFDYPLPEERIAKFPLPDRSNSRLLVWNQNEIAHHHFFELPELLTPQDHLIFNNTQVIPARLFAKKNTGAQIELLLLEPVSPSPIVALAMQAHQKCIWKCMIGGLKKWKDGEILLGNDLIDDFSWKAQLINREQGWVEFTWVPETLPFCEVLNKSGHVPLPPYLQRPDTIEDRTQYQTVYAEKEGAVAAPTAGLHFTPEILETLAEKGISMDYVTLHVGAGTFKPLQTLDIRDHDIHSEQIIVEKKTLQALLHSPKRIIAVGTTSIRTVESLYWFAANLEENPNSPFVIKPNDPYRSRNNPPISTTQALEKIMNYLEETHQEYLSGETSLYIYPGYSFKMVKGLITNFHQPGSTLLPLVAAFVGQDWKKIYAEALEQPYRFLSFGDSSLLLPRNT
jgi:S-adenosylmethionine:tRNA ribosyltransferase-isomerase